jgi:hypothetical protein
MKGIYQPLDGGPPEIIVGTSKLHPSFSNPTTFFLAWHIYVSICAEFKPEMDTLGLLDGEASIFCPTQLPMVRPPRVHHRVLPKISESHRPGGLVRTGFNAHPLSHYPSSAKVWYCSTCPTSPGWYRIFIDSYPPKLASTTHWTEIGNDGERYLYDVQSTCRLQVERQGRRELPSATYLHPLHIPSSQCDSISSSPG